MKDLIQLYKDLENFEKDLEQDSFADETLARMAFQEYINNSFSQMQLTMQDNQTNLS
ncbi:MAG: hypothetical protein KAU21_00030 [Gammaproteobacteria bacterium]|nr:hypothetical protein [Gammaproteobacteria bacterium]